MNKNPALILMAIIAFLSFAYFACAQDLRDPFVSLGDKMEAAQKSEGTFRLPYPIILKGTLCSQNKVAAIINNDIIKEGQKWQDFYVAKIEKGKVILEWRDKKFEITLAPQEGKSKEK